MQGGGAGGGACKAAEQAAGPEEDSVAERGAAIAVWECNCKSPSPCPNRPSRC